jgi:hypothetical protein
MFMLRLPLPNDDFESRPNPYSPNEDVGSVNKKDEMLIFEGLFQGREYSIWDTDL